MVTNKNILLGHGSGGKLSHQLIRDIFIKHFDNPVLSTASDAAVLDFDYENIAFTTDSYVVDPLIFPGGDIGKLAICGTVNDLSVAGATPLYLSAGFILEEGLPVELLESVVKSMAVTAKEAGMQIVTGDTKVVNRGKCDKIFINTAGIGSIDPHRKHISTGDNIKAGDLILLNGHIADHGIAVMCARNEIQTDNILLSDCAPLNGMIGNMLEKSGRISFMRDATRGGIGTVFAEVCMESSFGIEIDEEAVPCRESVRGLCEFFGFDPFFVANEGKVIAFVPGEDAEAVLDAMKSHKYGKDAAVIGRVVDDHAGKVMLNTVVGGRRIIDMLAGEQLPRIC